MKISKQELATMVDAYGKAWREEDKHNDNRLTIRRGARREAGLTAALRAIGIEVEQ
jgi:hypothetical protein